MRGAAVGLYGGDAAEGGPPPPMMAQPTMPQHPLSRRRSQSLKSLDSSGSLAAEGGIPSPAGESPASRRRSTGKLQHRTSHSSTSLSKKTLNIVTNLQAQGAGSRKEKEEAEEERRLALEEKRKQQQHVAGPYVSKDADCDYTIRLLLLGDSGVGKTSLMHRYAEDAFAMNLLSTAGVDFKVRHVTIDGKKVKVQVWDTAGQEKFHVITRTYYKGAHGIALIYDVTDPDSFKNVNYWMANIQTHADEKVHRILLGNKTDLPDQRQVQPEQGQTVAREFGIGWFETSAKDGSNVETGLNALVSEVIERLEAQQAEVEAAAAQANTASTGKGSGGLQRRLAPGAKGLPSGDKCCVS